MTEQPMFPGCQPVAAKLSTEELIERERLKQVCDEDRDRREDALYLEAERTSWRRRVEEGNRRRAMTPAERSAEDRAQLREELLARFSNVVAWAVEGDVTRKSKFETMLGEPLPLTVLPTARLELLQRFVERLETIQSSLETRETKRGG